jgi:hypothetical protein
MLTPFCFASFEMLSMMSESPAWKPQATLALVTMSSIAASSPMDHMP